MTSNSNAHPIEGPMHLWQWLTNVFTVNRDSKGVPQSVKPNKATWAIDESTRLVMLSWKQVPDWAKYDDNEANWNYHGNGFKGSAFYDMVARVLNDRPT
ncbi:hypothetical protein ACQY0O_008258 [Thecaphora frezii]